VDSAFALIAEHESRISQPLLDFLAQAPSVRLLGDSNADCARVPTISFTVAARDSASLTPLTEKHRIAIRHGHFYAYRAVRDLGLLERGGVVRVSLAHYNTPAEVTRLTEALDEAIG